MNETICDRCGRALDLDVASDGTGEWEGAVLCPDCAALQAIRKTEEVDAALEQAREGKPMTAYDRCAAMCQHLQAKLHQSTQLLRQLQDVVCEEDAAIIEAQIQRNERGMTYDEYRKRYLPTLEQARAEGAAARAVIYCANLHTNFDADVTELVDEMGELIDALNGEHEHNPQNELVQIGAYAINILRRMGDVPSLGWIESEAERHRKEAN